tara:strand:- start:32 stop:1315 length:1284 start_codon:yes stop_codon:yes gene_type:complete
MSQVILMKENNITKMIALGLLAGVAATASAQAQEDGGNLLLRKLVEKGILTQKEADELQAEARRESEEHYTMWQQAPDLPSWVQKLSMKGDFRLRFDGISGNDDTASTEDAGRPRFRYRLRYGVTATLNDDWKVGFRLASGGQDDAISTNQSFDDDGENDMLNIDQAYVAWTPNDAMTLTMGKMPNTFSFDKAIIDGDYTPEGVAFNYERDIAEDHAFGFGVAGWVIDEASGGDGGAKDTYAAVAQVTLDSTLSETMTSHLGFGTYAFINGDSAAETTKNAGNTSGANHSPLIFDAALTYKGASVPVTLGGTYINNTSDSANDTGYLLGVKINKAQEAGSWELSYQYRKLEADSVFDNWTDSDYGAYGVNGTATDFNAGTNLKGHVIKAKYQVNSAMQGVAAYYIADAINTNTDTTNRLQLDLIWKF